MNTSEFPHSHAVISTASIAALAAVQRSVVSVWKSRYQGTELAFPTPVLHRDQTDYFDVTDVAQWFKDSELGNNPDAAQDIFAYTDFDLLLHTHQATPLIEAALTLRSLIRAPLSASPDQLISDADDYDPDNTHLFSEIQALTQFTDQLPVITDIVNTVFDQSFSLSHALAVLASRERNHNLAIRSTLGSPDLSSFAAQVLTTLSQNHLDALQFVDLDSAHFEVIQHLLADEDYLASAPGLLQNYPFVRQAEKRDQGRQTLRRLIAHGLSPQVLPDFDGTTFNTVASFGFISPTASSSFAEDLLTAKLPDLAQSCSQHISIIIGPHDILLGAQSSAVERVRSELIRSGHLRCLAKLPNGLFPSHHRQQMALWVLKSPTDRPLPNEPVYLADLTGVDFHANVRDIIADISAATAKSPNRAYAYFAARPISRVVTTQSIDFPKSKLRTQSSGTSGDAVVLSQLLGQNEADSLLPSFTVTALPNRSPTPVKTSVAEAQAARLVAVISGNAIEIDWKRQATANDLGTRVITHRALLALAANPYLSPAQVTSNTVDALTLGQLPQLRLTKPGDLVFFQHNGDRAAWVDIHGGNLIEQPLRVLRPRSQRVVNSLLARDINGYQPHPHAWKQWSITILPDHLARDTTRVLTAIETQRRHLVSQLERLNQIGLAAGDAVARGSVRISLAP